MPRNILMICYYYPPLIDVGCKRSVAFSKYFKKHGWVPYVLTVKNPDKTYCLMGNDHPPEGVFTKYSYSVINPYKLAGKLNGLFTNIMRLFKVEINRNYFYDLLCIPDLFWGWIPLAVYAGLKIIRRKRIDLIYVSCSPFSAAFIGIILKILARRPLIIDFRDTFALKLTTFGYSYSKPHFRKQIDLWLENSMLNWADLFLVTTEEMRELYANHYARHARKIYTLHNGFESAQLSAISDFLQKHVEFSIIYSGNFYPDPNEPYVFFRALALLKKQNKINERTFQFVYYGGAVEHISQISQNLGIDDLVAGHPHISHEKLLSIIRRCHLHLIRIRKPMISTKLFEAIVLNVPVLAIIPSGEAERLIKEFSPSSYVITESSPKKVAEAILDAMDKYDQNQIKNNRVSEFLDDFSRENLTLKFMKLVENKIPPNKSSLNGSQNPAKNCNGKS